jgi:hypothetical protein
MPVNFDGHLGVIEGTFGELPDLSFKPAFLSSGCFSWTNAPIAARISKPNSLAAWSPSLHAWGRPPTRTHARYFHGSIKLPVHRPALALSAAA